jgi:hypothetical protein
MNMMVSLVSNVFRDCAVLNFSNTEEEKHTRCIGARKNMIACVIQYHRKPFNRNQNKSSLLQLCNSLMQILNKRTRSLFAAEAIIARLSTDGSIAYNETTKSY